MFKIIPPPARSQWWLDSFSEPNKTWAVLQVDDEGHISVFDPDGQLHLFDTVRAAEIWLTLAGYDPLEELHSDPHPLFCSGEDPFNELRNGIPRNRLKRVK